VADIWYNLIYTGSSILLIATSPILGIIADKQQKRMPYLIFTTLMMFVCIIGVSLIALLAPVSASYAFLAAGLYMMANYFYQFSFSFYNPMLNEIAPPEKRGLVSGLGQAANWLGAIVGIAISLAFLGGTFYLFGHPGRAQTFLPVSLLFFALALPALFLLKDQNPQTVKIDLKQEYKNYFASFWRLVKSPGVGLFLLAFFFFNDAILTAENNFPIYMEQVFHVSDKVKSLLLGGILITSVFGALLAGYLSDKKGLKKTLVAILIIWAIIFPGIGLIKNFAAFTGFAVLMGLLYGATWTVTRAVMAALSPKENLNQAFSYYTLSERFATFVGPITWGLITTGFIHKGPARYQIAIVSLTVFILIGLWLVRKLPNLNNSI